MIITKKITDIGKMRVQKSISLDLDLLQKVIDESVLMQRDFSGSISVLITMGLGVREAQRFREEEAIKEVSKKV